MRRIALAALVFLNACIAYPDRQWERLQAKHEWLYKVDDRPWKSWITHSVVTVGVGHLLALTPWIDVPTGLRIMVAAYVAREAWNILADGNRNYTDAFGDAATPFVVAEIWIRLR